MIPRNLLPTLLDAARWYPIVTLTGPRQSGKTTLCRAAFPHLPYVSLEELHVREEVLSDPRGFLSRWRDGAIFDEVQHTPELLSYLQVEVDERPAPGRFILTGSQHFALTRGLSQSLAGRTAVLHLLPLSHDEVQRSSQPPQTLLATLLRGGYPRIHDHGIPAGRWLTDYVATYVQRDVRSVMNIGDLRSFSNFLLLSAGRTAQELNLTGLGADAGITHATVKSWISVLEAGFLAFLLPAWHTNVRKQVVKAPKLHLLDSGLACHLLGIHTAVDLHAHPLRGAIFESWVVSEVYKAFVHRGQEPRLRHYRETRGLEIDLVIDEGRQLGLIEAKSGATVQSEHLTTLRTLMAREAGQRPVAGFLVHGGVDTGTRQGVELMPWSQVASLVRDPP